MLASVKRYFRITLAFLGGAGFLFFAMVNRETVSLDLTPIPAILEMRLFLLVGLLILAGSFLGWMVASFECRRRYLLKKETAHRLAALEEEVKALRARGHLPDHSPARHTYLEG